MKRKAEAEKEKSPKKQKVEEFVELPKLSHHSLNSDDSSWVEMFTLPTDLIPTKAELKALWDLHPTKKGLIKMMGKEIETPRWHQSYGKPYHFTGMKHDALPFPPSVQKYLDWANKTKYTKDYTSGFNMCLMNWYENGAHYIGPHADDTKDMVKGPLGESVVFSISFGQSRDFVLAPKKEGKKLKIPLKNATVVVMGGHCQKTHKHSVPKVTGEKGLCLDYRINLTFRIFK